MSEEEATIDARYLTARSKWTDTVGTARTPTIDFGDADVARAGYFLAKATLGDGAPDARTLRLDGTTVSVSFGGYDIIVRGLNDWGIPSNLPSL